MIGGTWMYFHLCGTEIPRALIRYGFGMTGLCLSLLIPGMMGGVAWGQTTVPPEAICMMREQADGTDLSIILPKVFAERLEKRGFVVADCKAAFKSDSRIKAWRDSICDVASNRTEEVQLKYDESLGERPAVLCALAEAVIGPSTLPNGRKSQ
jgi:hypothetical protein